MDKYHRLQNPLCASCNRPARANDPLGPYVVDGDLQNMATANFAVIHRSCAERIRGWAVRGRGTVPLDGGEVPPSNPL